MKLIRFSAWPLMLLAILSWGGYWYMTTLLRDVRVEYVAALEESEQRQIREQSLARVQAVIRDTETERAALDRLIAVTVVQAVDIVEEAGAAAGARDVRIVSASPSSAPKELSGLSIMVSMNGSFGTMMRAIALFESLPIPSIIEQIDLEKEDGTWRLTARLKLFLAANAT